jgi:hypothetical protein
MIGTGTKRRDRRRCAGSVYVLVLGASMLVTVIGAGAVLALRSQARANEADLDFAQARFYAEAGIERGRRWLAEDTAWRLNRPNGAWVSGQSIGDGTYALAGADPADGSLADAFGQDFALTATGQRRSARYMLQVTLRPVTTPIEPLFFGVAAKTSLEVQSGAKLTVTNGTATSNGDLRVDGTLIAAAAPEARTRSGTGGATPVQTLTDTPKNFPDSRVFNMYRGLATPIAASGGIEKRVLTPWLNPWGAANANGVYYVDGTGGDVVIKGSRIHGTLVVKAGTRKVIIDDAAFLHRYRSDYPALVVEGNVEIKLRSKSYGLSETNWAVNFNPTNAPFNGLTDAATGDEYPNEIRGLVHATGTITLLETARVVGGVISETQVVVQGDNEVVHNRALTVPSWGYVWEARYEPVAGSWKQVVSP